VGSVAAFERGKSPAERAMTGDGHSGEGVQNLQDHGDDAHKYDDPYSCTDGVSENRRHGFLPGARIDKADGDQKWNKVPKVICGHTC